MPTLRESVINVLMTKDSLTVREIAERLAKDSWVDNSKMNNIGRVLRSLERDGRIERTGFKTNAINRPVPIWKMKL